MHDPEFVVKDINHRKVTVSRAECSLVRHGFWVVLSISLGRATLCWVHSAVSSPVDSKSYEVKRYDLSI